MSHIFDALQRSEAESAGAESQGLLEANELLRRAERRANSQWESETTVDRLQGSVVTGQEALARLAIQVAPPETEAPEVELPPADTVSRVDAAEELAGFPSVAIEPGPKAKLLCLADTNSLAAEAFRLLGVRLRHLRRDRPLKKVLVTSTIPEEGKSMVAANLACTLALTTRQRTLLLEGDVRRPSLTAKFALHHKPGLCDWLRSGRSSKPNLYRVEGPGFWILPAGDSEANPLELLQSRRLSTLMEQLTAAFEWIVIDSPPVLPLADTSVWSRIADGILLVARQGTTRKRQLKRGIEALEPRKLIGALVNSSTSAGDTDYYYRPTPETRPSQLPVE